jgi:prepilin-type N-terminal cleavage/methylation domain-containing protein
MSGPSRSQAGFALLEVLVSLVLLAVVLAMLPGTLRAGQRAWETAGQQSEVQNHATGLDVIARRLESAMPVFERLPNGLSRAAFAGTETAVSWVTSLPDGPSGGGLYKMSLGAKAQGGGETQALLLTMVPFGRNGPPTETVIADRIGALGFRYATSAQGKGALAQWQSTWGEREGLPTHIELLVRPVRGTDSRVDQRRVVAIRSARSGSN